MTNGGEALGIELDGVSFGYPSNPPIASDLTWGLVTGGSAVITGQNGCGKSTLLYLAAGLLAPATGTVKLAGQSVADVLPSERFRRGIRVGFVFQEGGLLANRTARANVTLALHYHADVMGLTEEQIAHRCEEAFEQTEIRRADWDQLPAHLSFGNRKRLALARALAIQPRFFFFDDPDVGLDQQTAHVIHVMLCLLRDNPEVTLLVATNRAALMDRLEVPGYQLENGQLEHKTQPISPVASRHLP